jgi:carbamoyltransferase
LFYNGCAIDKKFPNPQSFLHIVSLVGSSRQFFCNGKLFREKIFHRLWIQPAAGDVIGAFGAALGAHHIMLNQLRKMTNSIDAIKGAYLGPEFSQQDITEQLTRCGAIFKTLSDDEIVEQTAQD